MGKRYSIIPYKGPKKYNCSAEQETDAFHKNKNIPPKIVEIRFETETTSIILKGFVFLKYLFKNKASQNIISTKQMNGIM